MALLLALKPCLPGGDLQFMWIPLYQGEEGTELCGWRADEEEELGSSWMVKTERPVVALHPVPASSQVRNERTIQPERAPFA